MRVSNASIVTLGGGTSVISSSKVSGTHTNTIKIADIQKVADENRGQTEERKKKNANFV